MTVQIQLDADRHAWPDDSAYAFDQITLAIVISLRNHGAMQIELHGVDRQRHLEIAEDFPPEVLIDAAQGRAGGLRIRRGALAHLMAAGPRHALHIGLEYAHAACP